MTKWRIPALWNFVVICMFLGSANGQVCCDPSIGPQLDGDFNPACGPTPTSPIIIDLSGTRFQLTSALQGVTFDIFANGHPVQVAWTAQSVMNGFLVLDRNDNSAIDDSTELFGNLTAQPISESPNGYLALGAFDDPVRGGNGDGLIDSRDSIFKSLRIWIDANHNGISDAGELVPLDQVMIRAVSPDFRTDMRIDEFGNRFRYRAKVYMNDGTSRWSYDVFLKTKQGYSTLSLSWNLFTTGRLSLSVSQ